MKKSRQYVLDKSEACEAKGGLSHSSGQVKIVLVLIFSLYAVYCLLLSPFMAASTTGPAQKIRSG